MGSTVFSPSAWYSSVTVAKARVMLLIQRTRTLRKGRQERGLHVRAAAEPGREPLHEVRRQSRKRHLGRVALIADEVQRSN